MKHMYTRMAACLMMAAAMQTQAQVKVTGITATHNGKLRDRGVMTYNAQNALSRYLVYERGEAEARQETEYTLGADEATILEVSRYGSTTEKFSTRIFRDQSRPGWIAGSFTLTYQEGNQPPEGEDNGTMQYDSRNRLTRILAGGGTISYTWNDDNQMTGFTYERREDDNNRVVNEEMTVSIQYTNLTGDRDIITPLVFLAPMDGDELDCDDLSTDLYFFLLCGRMPIHLPSGYQRTYRSQRVENGVVTTQSEDKQHVSFSYTMNEQQRPSRITITYRTTSLENGEEDIYNSTAVLDITYTDFSTGIPAVQAARTLPETTWYSPSGMRLASPRKGLNISKGRKLMVK